MTKKLKFKLVGILIMLACFAFALGFAFMQISANAETIKLSAVEDFEIDETGKLFGLSESGEDKIDKCQYFELIFPANVTHVSTMAFCGNDKLVKISFAENSECKSLKYGKKWSNIFSECTSLREVDFTNALKLTEIGNSLFAGCTSLSEVSFAENVASMSISQFAFQNTALTSFEIPAYVTSLDSSAFSGCSLLTTLTVADGNEKYTYYTDESGDRYDQAVYEKDAEGNITAFAVAATAMKSITIPKSVLNADYVPEDGEDEAVTAANIAQAVADKANTLNWNIQYIDGLETIEIEENDELYAYGNCLFVKEGSKLTSDTLVWTELKNDVYIVPKSVKKVTLPAEFTYKPDDGAYFWVYLFEAAEADASVSKPLMKLTTINVDNNNPVYTSFGGSLFTKDKKEFWIPHAATSFTVPKEITELDFSALSANKLLQEVTVEEGNTAYISSDGLLFSNDFKQFWIPYTSTSFTLPKEITNFDFSALAGYKYLKEIKISEGHPTYISDNGLIYNKGKTELSYVPQDVTEFYVPKTLEKISEYAFAVYDGDKRVANNIKKVYVEDLEAWCKIEFGGRIETPEQYMKFEKSPYNDDSMVMVSEKRRRAVAADLKNGYGANPMSGGADMYVREGNGWSLLEQLVVDYDGELSDLAFAGCKSLRTVTVTDKLKRVGEMSFAMCKNIRSITLPYVGITKEYVEVGIYNDESAYAWEVFGGRGLLFCGSAMYGLAPEKIDVITVTGYNILTGTKSVGDSDIDMLTDPVYMIPRCAFQNAPARKIVINIEKTDGHGITLGRNSLLSSTVSEIDLEKSNITDTEGAIISNTAAATDIKIITVPKTMKKIPMLFFHLSGEYNNSLEKVIIPEGVEFVEYNEFGNLDTLILPSTIVGFDKINGVKTVYLTDFNDVKETTGQTINASLASSGIYVALDSEIYAKLPKVTKDDTDIEGWASNKIFYQVDVVFKLKDFNGNVLAEKTEKHLAAQGKYSKSYLKWVQTQGAGGDVYWALDENYSLPDAIGNYKANSSKWTLDGVSVDIDTCLHGSKQQYVIEQTLEAGNIKLTPENVVKKYDGENWNIPAGMEIISIEAVKGGNNYSYSRYSSTKTLPVDAGTYFVTAECTNGYVWYDDESDGAQHTFTLQITPASVDTEWFYCADGSATGQKVTGTVPERMYDGRSSHSWFYAEFTDVAGKNRRVEFVNLSLYVSGDRSMPVYKMTDAGTYDVTVNDSGRSTDNVAWLGNYTFENCLQFVVTPRVIDLNDYNNLTWGLEKYNSSLRDGSLYIYNGKPYMYEQPELGVPDQTLYVLDSIVRLRDEDDHKIIINNIPALLAGNGAQYSAVYTGNTASAEGRYIANAVLTVADKNYVFGYSLGGDLKSRGMTITINPDGSATITKVWYVVAIDNGMLSAADGEEYKISGWTFGEDVTYAAPRLEHGDEDEEQYLTNGNVHFTLKLDGKEIATGFARDKFDYYINKSMPAGRYELTCTVSNVTVTGNHTHWWNNEEHTGADANVVYHGFTRVLVFEIQAAEITFTLPALSSGGFANYDWKYNAENKEAIFSDFVKLLTDDTVTLAEVTPTGFWAEHSADYYGKFTAEYNLARMNNDSYFSAERSELLKHINKPDDYVIYFNLKAPNHAPLTDASDSRYGYLFCVTVYQTIQTPIVNNVVYSGNRILPEVAESVYYTVAWNDDGYVSGGAHSVTFELTNPAHYRWESSSATGEEKQYLTIGFTIEKAVNEWLRNPNIIAWNYGGYTKEANRILAVPKFLDDGKNVLFSIVNKDGTPVKDKAGNAIGALKDFTADTNGLVSKAVADALLALDAGKYKLVSKVEGTGNYLEKVTSDTEFEILPASNEWVVTPNVIRWSYSNYDKTVNLILASAKLKNNPVDFRVYSDEAQKNALTDWFTAPDGIVPDAIAEVLKTLGQGRYYLVSKVEADGTNYSGLAPEPQPFNIAKAANNWLVTPNVIQWSYGGFDANTNLVLATARYSDGAHPITFKICTDEQGKNPVAGLEGFTTENGVVAKDVADKLAAFGTGTYYLISSVTYGENDNYTSLSPKPQKFAVGKAINAWTVTPGVTTWITGNYDNEEDFDAAVGRIFAEARFGRTDIIITEVDNEENVVYDSAKGIDNLAAAKAGIYALTAKVAGTADYSELTYSFNFKIFPKEGLPWWATLVITGGTLLIAAAIIFILWKKGVFQILTGKIVLAIRTRASIDATIASVRAAKKMEEGRKSVEEAKKRERIEELKKKAAEMRSMPAEERAAMLEAKAAAQAEKAEKMRSKSESMMKRAERMRNKSEDVAREPDTDLKDNADASGDAENEGRAEAAATDDNNSEQ